MACNLAKGRTEPCKQYVGGIDEIYFIKWSDVDFDSMTNVGTDNVTMYALTPKSGATVSAYKYDLKGVNSFESTSSASQETSVKLFDQSITVTLKGLDFDSSEQFNELVSQRTIAFVKDRNYAGYYFFGVYNGMTNNGAFASGQAMADMNGVTFTATGQERVPYKQSSASLASLNIAVSATVINP